MAYSEFRKALEVGKVEGLIPSLEDNSLHLAPHLSSQVVDEVMTTDVVKISETAPLHEAMRIFASKPISWLPGVARDDTVVGLLSARDIVTCFFNELDSTKYLSQSPQ